MTPAATVTDPLAAGGAAVEAPVRPRPGPLAGWLAIGVAVLVVQAYTLGSWLAAGPEQLSAFREDGSSEATWAAIFQVLMVAFAVVTVTQVVRRALRERAVTRELLLLVAFASIVWLDPMLNYLRPGFLYSQEFVNVSSWLGHMPGQLAPHVNLTVQPVAWELGTYVGSFLPAVLATAGALRWILRRRPAVPFPLAVAGAWGVALLCDIALELPMLRTGTFAYPSGWHDLSFWGGETYQFPIVEALGASGFWVACAVLLVRGDATNSVWVDRGALRIRSPARRNVARFLAVIGAVHVMFLALPMGVTQLGVLHTDPWPRGYPLHLTGGWCGDQGQPYGPCPGPGVPVQVRDGGDPEPEAIYRDNGFLRQAAGGLTGPPASP